MYLLVDLYVLGVAFRWEPEIFAILGASYQIDSGKGVPRRNAISYPWGKDYVD